MEEKSWLSAPIATLVAAGITVVIASVGALIYTPISSSLDQLKKDVNEIRSNPAPKPETKVEIEAIKKRLDSIDNVHVKLDDKLDSLRDYLIQCMPVVRPQILPRRGGLKEPFQPDG